MMVLLVVITLIASGATADERIVAMLSGKRLELELVDKDHSRQKGLMFRRSLAENHGMLFVFDHSQILSFWMKNTFKPLSIGYFDEKMKLIDIQDMDPVTSEMEIPTKYYVSASPAILALEVNKGWFLRNKVKVNEAFLSFPSPPKSRLLRKILKK